MWWAKLKGGFGQRLNLEGMKMLFGKDNHLAIPHLSVPDISFIDWVELKNRGFQGVVFDKDNTLTIPYHFNLWPPLGHSLQQCKSLFGNNVAVLSNSAGLYEYDPDGTKAKAIETAIGISVIRHRVKKPAGTADEIEIHFQCESSRLVMVGDRAFTDIVFGNRNGFLTILTEPLSVAEEPFIVRQVSTDRRFPLKDLRYAGEQQFLLNVMSFENFLKKIAESSIITMWSRGLLGMHE